MGSIFGYYLSENKTAVYCAAPLFKWNEKYGSEKTESTEDGILFGSYTKLFRNNQPFSKEIVRVGNYIAVADALIYNRDELESAVNFDGDIQNVPNDELLIRYIAGNGFDALQNVNGDFSGAVYDVKAKELILFRDHLGVRPLFYYDDGNLLAFSTDIRGIAYLPDADISPNEDFLYLSTMGYNELTLCRTEFEKINCIRPASYTVFYPFDTTKTPDVHIYWEPKRKKIRCRCDEEYISNLRKLIEDSLARRLKLTDRPIGCELSGGLDSSTLSILVNRLGYEGKYYSWSLDERDLPLNPNQDERQIIYDICRQEHIECKFSRKGTEEEFDASCDAFFENNIPYINTKPITEGASWMYGEGARMVVSGHGGDEGVSRRCNLYELFRNREYLHFYLAVYRQTKGIRLRLACTVVRILRQIFYVNPGIRKEYRGCMDMVPYIRKEFSEKMKGLSHPPLFFAFDPVGYCMQGGMRVRLDNTAVQGAEAGMQYIFPYLDYRVFDYAVSIPRYLYQNGRGTRWIFREAFKAIMPQSLIDVRYKDVASLRDYIPDDDEIKYSEIRTRKSLRRILNNLDCKPWNNYFDIGSIYSLLDKDILQSEDIELIGSIINMLSPFNAIQKIMNDRNDVER